ncbi:MAG: TcpE family conjugal transfer membrane protein [Acidimicrobiales bacterium]
MIDEPDAEIVCATYTHARRHPMVMGQIGGWTPPFQLTLTQLAVLVITFIVETQTWRWWGQMLPRLVGIVVALGLPCVLAWVVRRTRLEGRSLVRYAVGWVTLISTPHGGRVGGRAYRPVRQWWPVGGHVYVAPGEDDGS